MCPDQRRDIRHGLNKHYRTLLLPAPTHSVRVSFPFQSFFFLSLCLLCTTLSPSPACFQTDVYLRGVPGWRAALNVIPPAAPPDLFYLFKFSPPFFFLLLVFSLLLSLSQYISVWLSVCYCLLFQSLCLHISLSVSLSLVLYLPVCLFLFVSLSLSVSLFVRLSVSLSPPQECFISFHAICLSSRNLKFVCAEQRRT